MSKAAASALPGAASSSVVDGCRCFNHGYRRARVVDGVDGGCKGYKCKMCCKIVALPHLECFGRISRPSPSGGIRG